MPIRGNPFKGGSALGRSLPCLAVIAVVLLAPAGAAAATTTRQRIVSLAERQLGYTSPGDFCTKYGPCELWCSLFVTWLWRHAGVPVPSLAFTGYLYDWAKLQTAVEGRNATPKPGDAVLFGTGPASVATSRHTGIVEAVYPRYLVTIEGDSLYAVRRFVVPRRDPQLVGEPGPIYGYAEPVAPAGASPRKATTASFPYVSPRVLELQQDKPTQTELGRLEAAITSLRAFQHMPYRTTQARINWTGISPSGRVEVTVKTARHISYAQRVWKAFLRRWDDAGHAYQVTYRAAPNAPAELTGPSISGTAAIGQTVTVQPGNWTNSPLFFTYQWELCDAAGASCSAISGANSDTYTVPAADLGQTLRVEVGAWNDGGAGPAATTAATAPVAVAAL